MAYDPEIESLRAQLRSIQENALGELNTLRASMERDREALKREHAERQRENAERARSGEMGQERAQLQRRIDKGETTWAKVISGEDDHPSAAAARRNIDQNLETIAEKVREDPRFAEANQEAQEYAADIRRDEY